MRGEVRAYMLRFDQYQGGLIRGYVMSELTLLGRTVHDVAAEIEQSFAQRGGFRACIYLLEKIATELRRLEKLCEALVGEEKLHQDGEYETEMSRLTVDNQDLCWKIKQQEARIEELEAAIRDAPSHDCNLIVFEGCDVVAVAPEDLEDLKALLPENTEEPTDA